MRHYLWKITGGDPQLLEQSGKDSQYSFTVVGLLFLLVNTLIAIGFFGMFWGIFDNVFTALLGTLTLGFLVSNIYRLNLISLDPHTLPIAKEEATLFWTYFLRYSTILMLAFFVSKTFEMVIVSYFENMGFINYDGSSGYMHHLVEMNQEQPWVWGITFIVLTLFVIPIYLKARLKRHQEYYSLKERRDIRIVREHYKGVRQELNSIYGRMYSDFGTSISALETEFSVEHSSYPRIFPKRIDHFTYKAPLSIYKDEPFNTKLKEKPKPEYKTSSDFLSDILKES